MTPIQEYGRLLHEVEGALSRLTRLADVPLRCSRGCAQCCTPITILPIEAYAILGASAGRGEGAAFEEGRCPLLTPELLCGVYEARPLICRVRGFPVFFLDAEGKPSREACGCTSFPTAPAEGSAVHLDLWNARLYHINVRFCMESGIELGRIPIADFSRLAGLWLRLSEESMRAAYPLPVSL
jgi:hypothetical protein